MDQHEQAQRKVCGRYSADFTPIHWASRVAVAADFFSDALPKNGLRIAANDNMTGWYLYAGETMSEDAGYFKPYCSGHLPHLLPSVVAYLGLPIGWRFLLAPNYEDVWHDESLVMAEDSMTDHDPFNEPETAHTRARELMREAA